MAASIPPYYVTPAGYAALMAWYDRALRRLRVPFESRYVPTRYGSTHLLTAGAPDAPPLLLLHGINTNAAVWIPQINGLAQAFYVIAPDVTGFAGKSAATRLPYRGAHYGLWAQDVLDALGVGQVSAAGSSAGGFFALRMALAAPGRVQRLALLNPTSIAPYKRPYGWTRLPFLPPLLNWLNHTLLASETLAQTLVRKGTAPQLPLDAELVEKSYLLLKHYRRYPPPGVLTAAELRAVCCPVLLLVSADEVFHDPVRVARRAQRLLPDVTTVWVPDAGHDLGKDQPEWVNTRLRTFFSAQMPLSVPAALPVIAAAD